LAEIFAEVSTETVIVLTGNVAVVWLGAIETLLGTTAAGSSLDNVTTAPLDGAGALRTTIPVDGLPLITLLGLSVTESTTTRTGSTVKLALWVVPL
jgi:hypothetical protein